SPSPKNDRKPFYHILRPKTYKPVRSPAFRRRGIRASPAAAFADKKIPSARPEGAKKGCPSKVGSDQRQKGASRDGLPCISPSIRKTPFRTYPGEKTALPTVPAKRKGPQTRWPSSFPVPGREGHRRSPCR